jgi:hypothetical protein
MPQNLLGPKQDMFDFEGGGGYGECVKELWCHWQAKNVVRSCVRTTEFSEYRY